MEISPSYTDIDFKVARDDEKWEEMVVIFYDRLEGRFLKPIRLIENDMNIGMFSGFSILALDCLIIETLQQFYEGTIQSKNVGDSFKNFLLQSKFFKFNFDKTKARTFYLDFRNGLLHQAQTKNRSLIQIKPKNMVTEIEGGLIINRKLFHRAIEDEINNYKKLLISGEDKIKRKNFIKKMNFICNCK